jgi:molybdopterin synthase catalytic subunit
MSAVDAPSAGDRWLALTPEPLNVSTAHDWAVRPDCGAVVVFTGTVRDHADGRHDVTALTYEAYEEQVVPRLEAIADEVRHRWPSTGRIVAHHRVGRLALGDVSVLVAVSAGHRPEAFHAARYAIDALKASVPIWKQEHWVGGDDWGTGANLIVNADEVADAEHQDAT